MKRKFISLPITLTALAPAISLVGCGEPDTPEPTPPTPEGWIEWDYVNDGKCTHPCDLLDPSEITSPITQEKVTLNYFEWLKMDKNNYAYDVLKCQNFKLDDDSITLNEYKISIDVEDVNATDQTISFKIKRVFNYEIDNGSSSSTFIENSEVECKNFSMVASYNFLETQTKWNFCFKIVNFSSSSDIKDYLKNDKKWSYSEVFIGVKNRVMKKW